MITVEHKEKKVEFLKDMVRIVSIRPTSVKERIEAVALRERSFPSILQSFGSMCHPQAPTERGNHAGKATGAI